jgi:hypothetical protein
MRFGRRRGASRKDLQFAQISHNARQDVASMQRDLGTTLPGLLAQVESPGPNGPAALSPTFTVFRNLDALYDVLLRVSETAALAVSGPDASRTPARGSRTAGETGRLAASGHRRPGRPDGPRPGSRLPGGSSPAVS